jgi:hypothetical protein
MEERRPESMYDLLHHDHYTPQQLADLLEIGVHVIHHAAFTGALRAQIVGHEVISIRREDAVTWFERYSGGIPPAR